MTKPKPNKFTKEVGANIRYVRRSKEITVTSLAKAVGRHPKTIHGYENGNHQAPTDVLDNIATALGVSINRLLPKNNSKK